MIHPDGPLIEPPCSFCGNPGDTCTHEPPVCTPCCEHLSHDDPRDTLNGVVAWGVRVGE
jgi:hypothetical protein